MRGQYRFVVMVARTLLACFFRRIEVSGLEHIPSSGGGIVVSWHPNGLIDPALVITRFPRQIVFGARHGLFRVPVLGWLMRGLGTVPIYRAVDMGGSSREARREANNRSLDALGRSVVGGSFSALFPEGVSHDEPHLRALRPGVARLYYRARQLAPDEPPPVIIPVGLHYDEKHAFRSSALVQFHAPLTLPEELDITPASDEDEQVGLGRQLKLTEFIRDVLHDVVGATEDWEIHQLIHRVRKLFRAERSARAEAELDKPSMQERAVAFARVRAAYELRAKTHPEQTRRLRERVHEYDADLRTLGLDDHELDRNPRLASPWLAILIALQLVFVFLLLPPLLLVGYVANLPPAAVLLLAVKRFAKDVKDEATIKLLGGAVLFPLSWVGVGALVARSHDWLADAFPNYPTTTVAAGTTTAILAALGGVAALRYARVARQSLRSARVRLTRARRRASVGRLRQERAAIFEALQGLAADAPMPGAVMDDGRIAN
jgi:1-acyl-sn-glycerol-3-phosphate acyltransferase